MDICQCLLLRCLTLELNILDTTIENITRQQDKHIKAIHLKLPPIFVWLHI